MSGASSVTLVMEEQTELIELDNKPEDPEDKGNDTTVDELVKLVRGNSWN